LEQTEDAVGRDRGVEALLLHRRAEHDAAVAPREQVAAGSADYAVGRRRRSAAHAQLEDLALDGPDRRSVAKRRERGAPGARGDHDRTRGHPHVAARAYAAHALAVVLHGRD